jgi:hypothetical protein
MHDISNLIFQKRRFVRMFAIKLFDIHCIAAMLSALFGRGDCQPMEKPQPPIVNDIPFVNKCKGAGLVTDIWQRWPWSPLRVSLKITDVSRLVVILNWSQARRFRAEVHRGSFLQFSGQVRRGPDTNRVGNPIVAGTEVVVNTWKVNNAPQYAHPLVELVASVIDISRPAEETRPTGETVLTIKYVFGTTWATSKMILPQFSHESLRRNDVVAFIAKFESYDLGGPDREVLVCHELQRLPDTVSTPAPGQQDALGESPS